MKRMLFFAFCILISNSPLRAALLAYDPANYPVASSLEGLHGGFGWSTLWGGANTVTSSGLSFGSLRTSGRAFTTIGNNEASFRGLFVDGHESLTTGDQFGRDGTTIWLSFLFRRDRSAGGGEWAGLSLFNNESEELFVGVPVGQNVLGLHLWDLGQAPAGLALSSQQVEDGVVYLVVVRLTFGSSATRDLVELFINPAPGIEPSTPDAARIGGDIRFSWIRLASGYSTTRSTMDEIRIGTEYKDVVPGIALPSSAPRMVAPHYDRFNRFSALLEVETGYFYRVESSADLKQWTTVTEFLSYSPELRFQTAAGQSAPMKFFRIATP